MRCVLLAFLLLFVYIDASCVLPDGRSVPWFIAIKPARLESNPDAELSAGRALYYMAPGMTKFERATGGVNGLGMLAQTLAPLYTSDAPAPSMMWSDQPSTGESVTSAYAHMKGLVFADQETKTATLLVHSVPKFPNVATYEYGNAQCKYGQSFLCMTSAATELDTPLRHVLRTARPYVYHRHMDAMLMPKIASLTVGDYDSTATMTHSTLPGVLGATTAHYKTAQWGQEILRRESKLTFWERLATTIDPKGSMMLETWTNGMGTKLPNYNPETSNDCEKSSCSAHTANIFELEIDEGVAWERINDHSKWGITSDRTKIVCIGGVNHMLSQAKRGGGAVCFQNTTVWEAFNRIIKSVETD